MTSFHSTTRARVAAGTALALMALGLAACSDSSSGADSDTVVIGLLSDVSGPAGPCCGVPGKAGAELALAELNAAGGIDGKDVEFKFNDTQGAKDQAVRLYRRLADDGAVAVVGPTRTDEVLVLAGVADQQGVPFVSTGSRGPFPGDFGSDAFRIAISEEQIAGPFMDRLVADADISSIALISASDDPALQAGAEAFKEAAEDAGVSAVAEETFSTGDTDFSAQVTKIKDSDPDAVAIAAQVDDGGLIVAELARAGVDAQLVGLGGMASADWFEVAGEQGAGLLAATPFDPSSKDKAVTDFVSAYTEETGEAPGVDAAYGYASAQVIFEAVRRALDAGDLSPEAVREQLGQLQDFDTVVGPVTYDARATVRRWTRP